MWASTVRSISGGIICLAVVLSTGQATAQINPDDLLVMSRTQISEYTPAGAFVQAFDVPWPSGSRPPTERVRDAVTLPDGRIAVYNGTFTPWLSVFDPSSGAWDHRTFPGWSTGNNDSLGGIASFGNSVAVTDMSTAPPGQPQGMVDFNLQTGDARRFETQFGTNDVTLGLDGKLYALGDGLDPLDEFYVYDPVTLIRERTVHLPDFYSLSALAVNSAGQVYATDVGGNILKFSPDGALLDTIALGTWDPFDIDIDADGRIIFATWHHGVKITDETFSSYITIPTTNIAYVGFATYVPEPSTIALLMGAILIAGRTRWPSR